MDRVAGGGAPARGRGAGAFSPDPLIARDTQGLLYQRMEEAVDGEYQAYKANDGSKVL